MINDILKDKIDLHKITGKHLKGDVARDILHIHFVLFTSRPMLKMLQSR